MCESTLEVTLKDQSFGNTFSQVAIPVTNKAYNIVSFGGAPCFKTVEAESLGCGFASY